MYTNFGQPDARKGFFLSRFSACEEKTACGDGMIRNEWS